MSGRGGEIGDERVRILTGRADAESRDGVALVMERDQSGDL